MKRFNTRLLLIATVTCLLACAATTYAVYTVKELPLSYDSITDVSGRACGINNAGQVVGWTKSAGGVYHAFIYDVASDVSHYMGTLGGNSEPVGINNAGIATGWSNGQVFLYDTTNGMTATTGTSGFNAIYCIGLSAPTGGVNMIGGWSNGSNPLVPWGYACTWSPNTLVSIGNLGAGMGITFGCNDYGEMVGGAHNASYRTCAFRWTSAGGIVEIPAMADKLGKTLVNWWDRGIDVNNSGQVAGWGWYTNGLEKAWFWDPAVVPSLTEIPLLSGGNQAQAKGINNSGQVVGFSKSGDGLFHVFFWDPATPGTTENLEAGISGAGIAANNATADGTTVKINSAGVIAGFVSVSGVEKPVIWIPPVTNVDFVCTVTLVDWAGGDAATTADVTVDSVLYPDVALTGTGSVRTCTIPALAAGSHVVKVKPLKALSESKTGSTPQAFSTQCGDTNDDNKIDDLDFLSVIGNFGSTDPVLKLIGDGNGDDKTDDLDFLNVIGKFATSGT